MGKQRIIAETGAGQHGVATATACALLGLECVVYMGAEDIRRQRPTSCAWSLLGATVARSRRARGRSRRRSSRRSATGSTNVADTHYIIGSAVGPAPYPALVRDLQRVIGDEAREQMLERDGRLPERVVACVGGGSNAIGIFAPFIDDADVELVGVEAAGEGIETGRHGAPLTVGGRGPACCTARCRAILQDDDGQILEAHSISRRPRLPRRRARARLPARHRPRDATSRSPTRRRWRRSSSVARLEGIIPALETVARARTGRSHEPPAVRARPRLPVGPRRQGPGRGPRGAGRGVSTGAERIAAAFAAAAGARRSCPT